MGEAGYSHGPILPPSLRHAMPYAMLHTREQARKEVGCGGTKLGEVCNLVPDVHPRWSLDLVAGAYKALSKWGGSSSSSSGIAASSVGRCKDSRVAPLPGYFTRYYNSSAVSVNSSACNSINPLCCNALLYASCI